MGLDLNTNKNRLQKYFYRVNNIASIFKPKVTAYVNINSINKTTLEKRR